MVIQFLKSKTCTRYHSHSDGESRKPAAPGARSGAAKRGLALAAVRDAVSSRAMPLPVVTRTTAHDPSRRTIGDRLDDVCWDPRFRGDPSASVHFMLHVADGPRSASSSLAQRPTGSAFPSRNRHHKACKGSGRATRLGPRLSVAGTAHLAAADDAGELRSGLR
jgi:hypothetical protein